LEYVPSRLKVIRHVRPKLACVACEAIFQAAAPSRPIARGLSGPGLLANVFVSKYCDHIPLHRLSRIYGLDGVLISAADLISLGPLAPGLREGVRPAGWVVHCGLASQAPSCWKVMLLTSISALMMVAERLLKMVRWAGSAQRYGRARTMA
jgi:hypothetical protein